MKTRLLLLSALTLLSGCTDLPGHPEYTFIGTVRDLRLETVMPTRTDVSYDMEANVIHSSWASGDAVLLTDLVSSAPFTLAEGEEGKNPALFAGELPVASGRETLTAACPAGRSRLDGGQVKITLSPSQSAGNPGDYDLKAASIPREQLLDGNVQIRMNNLTSILKVKLTLPSRLNGIDLSNEELTSFSLETTKPLSGEGTLDNSNETPVLTDCAENTVTYSFASGTQAASTQEFLLFILPGAYTEPVIWTAETGHYRIRFRFNPGMEFLQGYFYTATFNLGKSGWTQSPTLDDDRDYSVEIVSAPPIVHTSGNVYGLVTTTSGNPVPGVVISDGYVVATTNAQGVYEFTSQKANGYVFISQPAGYEVPLDGVFPEFWQPLDDNVSLEERHDFRLIPVSNDDCVLMALGDFHLCNRNALYDLRQFRKEAEELMSTVTALQAQGKRVYGLTLGDMTWDIYWDKSSGYAGCNFDLRAYRNEIKQDFAGLDFPLWHTIGNHDHDYRATGDWDTVIPYKQILGPTYYSFNAGGYHIVSLDNVICENDGTSGGRGDSAGLTGDILSWLQADIAQVPSGMPVIVSMHEQAYVPTNPNGGYSTENYASSLESALSGRNVHIITGHTHNINTVKRSSAIYEHNAGALCATWWWTGRFCITSEASWGGGTSLADTYHIGRDGSPAGYTIYDLSSGTMNWHYKAFGLPASRQFKTYDRNKFTLTAANWCPNASSSNKTAFEKLAAKQPDYSYAKAAGESLGFLQGSVPNNLVYINVWNWDPDWSISVKEGNTNLQVTKLTDAYDPMHLVAYPATRYNSGNGTTSTFITSKTQHLFRVTASSATSSLTITVTDRFGNTYTETMTRPKTFAVNWD